MAIGRPITPGCGTLLLLMVAALSGETAAWFIGGGVAARGQFSNWVLSSVLAKLSQNSMRFRSLSLSFVLGYCSRVCVCVYVCVCGYLCVYVFRESVCVCVFCNTFKMYP